ncbi:MAG TPA: nicotinate (nicotinamide) nucleotide adenylyltransferase [Candidatus Dormibacteraeota bacterium]|nr:nicotinate (nicotinamide) nucleotide adenylyltransferase [Candidatus Dormibacteraeota bacterium]
MPAVSAATVFFGGTFDPPHLGHLSVIRGLRQQTGLPVLVVPTGEPVHRSSPRASRRQRAEMVALAIQPLGDPLVTISQHELEQSQPGYTVDTVQWLRSRTPERSVVLALGSDVAVALPGWKDVGRLLEQVRLLVFERPGVGEPGEVVLGELRRLRLPLEGAEVVAIPAPVVDATGIRDRLARGEDCSDLLPPAVSRYIGAHGLYRNPPEAANSSRAG